MSHKRNRCSLVRFAAYHFSVLALLAFGITGAGAVHAQVPSEFAVNYDEGFDEGYEVGYPLGYDSGFDIGLERGTDEGTTDGETEGYDKGWDTAYDPAYKVAYNAAVPVGQVAGFAETFPSAAAEGYQWASEIHSILTNPINATIFTNSFPDITDTLIGRWGDPSGWGSSSITLTSGFIGISSADFLILNRGITETDWAVHYYDEGYEEGYDEGKNLGDQEGFDEAYPLAYEAAYDLAFVQGSDEGRVEGLLVGEEEGYDEGWATGADAGESIGFQIGADLYVAGGNLENLDLSAFRVSYAASLGVSATVPEPTSLCLMGFFGLALASGRRPRRQ